MTKQNRQYPISPRIGKALLVFLHSQLFKTPESPTHSFEGQTIIVTGSNVGLGLEGARHFYRLNCAKLILAVRSVTKGRAAKNDIIASVKARKDGDTVVEVWEVDMSVTESVLEFVKRAKTELYRIDVLVLNAGVNLRKWQTVQDKDGEWELAVQVMVVNTFLLALSLLPNLRKTSEGFGGKENRLAHLLIISSEGHRLTRFTEIENEDVYAALNDKNRFNVNDRYATTKLMEILFVRELVTRLDAASPLGTPPVIMNLINPGLCASYLNRHVKPPLAGRIAIKILRTILERTAEIGGRMYVIAACGGAETHGEFMSDGQNQDVESWIYTEYGKKAQDKVFEQTMEVLEGRRPGLRKTVII